MIDHLAATSAPNSRPGSQLRASAGGASPVVFADVLGILTAHEPGASPAGIAQVVRDELKNANRVDIGAVAAEEMTSPTERSPAQRPASVGRSASPQARPDPRTHPGPNALSSGQPGGEIEGSRRAESGGAPTSVRSDAQSEPAPGVKPARTAHALRAPEFRASTPAAPASPPVSAPSGSQRASGVGRGDAIGGVSGAGTRNGSARFDRLAQQLKQPVFRAEREQVPSQVSKALANIISRGGGRLTLRLSPQSLGDVRVDVEVREGVASAVFRADEPSARDLLRSNLDALRTALEQRGVRVERLEVAGPDSESPDSAPDAGRDGGKEPAFDGHENRAASDRGSAGRPIRAPAEAGGGIRPESAAEPGSAQAQSVMVQRTGDGAVLRLDAIA